jgi:large subunit ribosomal protein L40
LFQNKQRTAHETELHRQQQAMSAACEELRTGCGERGSKLFRVSMNKKGVFTELFPIEYARLQTESPSRDGWNHGWKRM